MFKIPISSLKDVISFIKPSETVVKNEDGLPQKEEKHIEVFDEETQQVVQLKTRCFVKYLYGNEAYTTTETKVKQKIDFYIRNRRFLRDKLTNDCKIDYYGQIFDIIYINFLDEFIEIRGECNYEITN